ncbi:phospholipid/cholesterol/gamma-HCH transport system permease protein [Marinobacter daqiaonensis]|uniref:Phospholipid/cholesterol/gamma-HCH transport system permease protein n=1 Tax=Marinobacter daqiaonensis TaxID=650891 RepID=A0A1I6GNR1_9GAMM|nr:MlaE family lipid ABC transporter permease subunit [Marinobacter daqiaonensis]SFR43766.1 phospholipid/cholesterol/gamma-HCH transport system permease protein [Marinobacter daqiaonensis]
MPSPGQFEQDNTTLRLSGEWTLAHFQSLRRQVQSLKKELSGIDDIDMSGVEGMDSAGASVLAELLGGARLQELVADTSSISQERQGLLLTIARALKAQDEEVPAEPQGIRKQLARVGRLTLGFIRGQKLLAGFIGQTLATILYILPRPNRWRFTSLISHIQRTGLNALPIVALLTFLVGAVVAFLGATVLDNFGATIYTVHLVSFAFLREFGVVLAAILLAGRTASAYTAQLGSMKANEEIDALRAIGLDPMEMLVIPRVLAMIISLPFLTFVGMISGIFGGALVCIFSLDIPLAQFLNILENDIPINHFLVGLGKAPIFAFIVAVIGCLEGLKVSGSAESVGEHTTSSVVQAIFMVILLDAIAALFFMEMGW